MTTARKTDGWIGDTVGVFFDPIIVMPGGWGDSLPDWLKKRVTLERLCENMQALNEHREITATDAEAACYLYTASLTAPIGGDWTEIYLYVAAGEMKVESKNPMPEDLRVVDTLTESQWRDLRQLKAWIYRRRVQHRQEKARGERREARQVEDREELELKPVQSAFF